MECSVVKNDFLGLKGGLVLLRKGSQCFIGPLFTPFDPPTCVINSQKKMGVIVNNCTKESICS